MGLFDFFSPTAELRPGLPYMENMPEHLSSMPPTYTVELAPTLKVFTLEQGGISFSQKVPGKCEHKNKAELWR